VHSSPIVIDVWTDSGRFKFLESITVGRKNTKTEKPQEDYTKQLKG
jgi:hypothetical protein